MNLLFITLELCILFLAVLKGLYSSPMVVGKKYMYCPQVILFLNRLSNQVDFLVLRSTVYRGVAYLSASIAWSGS